MSRVDFYILPDENRKSLQHFACRLAEKAYRQGHSILIKTDNADDSRMMDDLLWSFKEDNFLPHAVSGTMASETQPILISHEAESDSNFQLLINMSSHCAEQNQFDRIAEILNQEPNRKQAGRLHYKQYKNFGFELQHHEINN
jgi:DNA polymerase III subunit chi